MLHLNKGVHNYSMIVHNIHLIGFIYGKFKFIEWKTKEFFLMHKILNSIINIKWKPKF